MASTIPRDPGSFNDETYHARNPLHPVQCSHVDPPIELSQAEKDAIYLERKSRKQNSLALRAELDTFHAECDEKIKALSKIYSTKENIIRNDVYNASSFKRKRNVNIWNAEVAYKAKSLRERGEKAGLARARAEVLQDRVQRGTTTLPDDQKDAILEFIRQERLLKQTGARPTNKSAAMDASFTGSRLQDEMRKLNKRTGAAGILIATRGHLNDSIAPAVFETDNASGFCKKALGHTLFDVGTRLESWTILQGQSQTVSNTKDLRKKCVLTIIEGLREVTGKDDAVMNYNNYEMAIKSRYKVHLVGWPPHVPFANPSTITTDQLQRLNDALQSFDCRWEHMTRDEVVSHNATQDARIVAQGAPATRKTRSDKGKKRSNASGFAATKRRKTGESSGGPQGASRAARQIPPRSAEFIDSDAESITEQTPTINSASTVAAAAA